MRGATQTRKRRVGWSAERTRFTYRYIRGLEIALGERHQGYYTDGQHAALRLSPVLWLGMLILLGATHAHIWIISLVFVQLIWTALFLPALFIWWAARRIVAWWQFRGMLDAFALTVGDILGWPRYTKPYLWLHFPMNWRKRKDAAIRIEMKYDAANSENKQKEILQAVATGLGTKIEDSHISWDLEVKPSPWPWKIVWPSLTIRPQFPPPTVAMFSDYLDVVGKSRKYSDIVPGIGEHGKPYRIDIATEFPHGGIYATPGQGKSVVLANIGCQAAHNGAVLVVLDPKRISLPCFHDLPNVVYAGTGAEIHHTLVECEKEMERRTTLMRVPRGTKRPDPGAPIVFLCEEADAMEDYLRRVWEQMSGSRSNPPSIASWRNMRFMGRELKMHQWIVSQSGSAKALGGGDARSALGNRFVSADESVWSKVAPLYKKDYPISQIPGRWWALKFAAPVPVQMFGFVDPPDGDEELRMEEARQWALSGRIGVLPDILADLKTRFEDLPDIAVPVGAEPSVPVGDIPVAPTSPTQVGDTPVPVPHLRLVGDAAGDRRAEWAGRIEAQITDLYAEPVAEDRWLTLGEARKAGILDPEKTMNATRIAASKSPLLEAHRRYREKPPYAGAREWPEDVLVRYARGTVNA